MDFKQKNTFPNLKKKKIKRQLSLNKKRINKIVSSDMKF